MTYKILQLISGPGLYGAERTVLELSSYLASRGVEVELATLESDASGPLARAARDRGLRCTTLLGELRHPVRLTRALSELVRGLGTRLVHSHSVKADAMSRLATYPAGVKRLATVHGRHATNSKLRLLNAVNRPALRLFDHVVAAAPRTLERLRTSGFAFDHTTLVDSGLDLPPAPAGFSAADTRAKLGAGPDDVLLVRACRLVPQKGVDILIKAVARQVAQGQPMRLALVGDGPQREALGQLVSRLGLTERVTFTGYREDALDLIRAADLMAISSRDDSLPRSLLEAMALGVPVVAANVGGGIRNLIQSGHSGWLVRRDDLDALSLALTDALRQPDLRAAYAEEARAVISKGHTREIMGQQYLGLYERLLG